MDIKQPPQTIFPLMGVSEPFDFILDYFKVKKNVININSTSDI